MQDLLKSPPNVSNLLLYYLKSQNIYDLQKLKDLYELELQKEDSPDQKDYQIIYDTICQLMNQ